MKNMKSLLLKTLGILVALSMVLTLSMAVLAAESYPSKPVKLIIVRSEDVLIFVVLG